MNDSVAMAMVLGFIAIGLILANRKLKILGKGPRIRTTQSQQKPKLHSSASVQVGGKGNVVHVHNTHVHHTKVSKKKIGSG